MNYPRDAQGKFLSKKCPDASCNGVLQEEDGWWHCNGLTYNSESGPLIACDYSIPPISIQRACFVVEED